MEEGLGRRFIIGNCLMLAAFVAIANLFWSPEAVKGVLLGGVIAILNCLGVYRDTWRLTKWRRKVTYFVGMLSRMVLIILCLGVFLKKFPESISMFGVVLGLSVVPVTFLFLVFQMLFTKNKRETSHLL